jgi:hypothetical protein
MWQKFTISNTVDQFKEQKQNNTKYGSSLRFIMALLTLNFSFKLESFGPIPLCIDKIYVSV